MLFVTAAFWEALLEELLILWELWTTAGNICISHSVCFVGMTEVSEFCFATAQTPFARQDGAGTMCAVRRFSLIPGVCMVSSPSPAAAWRLFP